MRFSNILLKIARYFYNLKKKKKKIEVIESEAITFKVDTLSTVQLMNDSPNNSLESLFSICKILLME